MKKKYVKTIISVTMMSVITISGMTALREPMIINASTTNDDFSVVMKDVSFNRAEGVEFEVPISINKLPNGTIKSGEIIINVPEVFEVTGVNANNDIIEAENLNYNVDTKGDKKLRIALTNLKTGELKLNKIDGEQVIVNLKLRVKSELQTGTKSIITVDRMVFRGTENTEVSYSFKGAESTVEATGGEITVTPRILYTGDGTDLIASDKVAVALEVKNASEYITQLEYRDSSWIIFKYNEEMSKKNNVRTYVTLCSKDIKMDGLTKWSNYNSRTGSKPLYWGEEHIDAQTAVDILSLWLRKSTIVNDEDILKSNVNGDGSINTLDVTDIVDNYVSNKELPILSK